MAKLLKLRRGTTTQHGSFTGAEGEVTIDTTKDTAVVHDGSTQGGRPLLREDASNLPDQSIQLNHLPHGTSSNNGKFLRANNGADPTFEVVNTDLVADTSPQLGGNLDTNGNNIQFGDSEVAQFGNSQEFQMWHDGTNSHIKNATGAGIFQLRTDNFRIVDAGVQHTYLTAVQDGAVKLYYDNTLKLETRAGDVRIYDDLKLGDGLKIKFGTADDLQLYHNGSTSYLTDAGSGSLVINSIDGNVHIRVNETEEAIKCVENGQVEIYHDGTKKLQTDSTGTIFYDDTFHGDDIKANFGASADLQIDHSGGVNRILTNGPNLKFGTTGETQAMFNNNGSVQLMYDNSEKLRTNSGGIEVLGHIKLDDSKYLKLGNSGGTQDVAIYHNGYNFHVQHTSTGSTYIDSVGDHNFRHSSTSEYRAAFKNNNSVDLYYDGSKKFQTTSTGITITGNVVVGQSTSSDIYMYDSDETTRRIHTNSGRIGFLNSSNDWSAYSANSGDFYVKGDLLPDGTHDIGSTSARWQNIYTSDLSLSNEAIGGNDIDGTWGDWTIQEGESDLFLKNNRSGKQYKFNLTEVS